MPRKLHRTSHQTLLNNGADLAEGTSSQIGDYWNTTGERKSGIVWMASLWIDQ